MTTRRKPGWARHAIWILGVTAATAAACGEPRKGAPAEAAVPIAVTVASATVHDVADVYEAGGVVRARTTATVTARMLAPVRELRVRAGDRVRAGQLLVILDAGDLTARTRGASAAARAVEQSGLAAEAEQRAAQAGVALARATYDRIASLHEKRSATPQELDNATASLKAAEARVSAAAARTMEASASMDRARAGSDEAGAVESYLRITAPFAGVVTETLIEVGDTAAPGTPLVRVEDTRSFRLEVRVDESRVRDVVTGATVAVLVEDGTRAAQSLTGTVTEVARAIDDDARAFIVKIALPDTAGVRSGIFGRARLPGSVRRTLTVPVAAILRHGQVTSVFVVDKHVARLRLVDVRGTEILAGLSEGEIVILNPSPAIVDGRAVVEGGR